jgi:hypothetical protein
MLPSCATPTSKEWGMFDFMLDVRPFFNDARRSELDLSQCGADEDFGGRQLPTSKELRKPSTGLTIFVSASDQA